MDSHRHHDGPAGLRLGPPAHTFILTMGTMGTIRTLPCPTACPTERRRRRYPRRRSHVDQTISPRVSCIHAPHMARRRTSARRRIWVDPCREKSYRWAELRRRVIRVRWGHGHRRTGPLAGPARAHLSGISFSRLGSASLTKFFSYPVGHTRTCLGRCMWVLYDSLLSLSYFTSCSLGTRIWFVGGLNWRYGVVSAVLFQQCYFNFLLGLRAVYA